MHINSKSELVGDIGVLGYILGEFLQYTSLAPGWLSGHLSNLAFPMVFVSIFSKLPPKLSLILGAIVGLGAELVQTHFGDGDSIDATLTIVGFLVGYILVLREPLSIEVTKRTHNL